MLSDWAKRFAAVVVRNFSSFKMKKTKIICKEVGRWVGTGGVGSCLEGCPYGLELITCR